ncbi:MAG: hypothetical protein HYX78_02535 [Armatimonadetes bacterium]|nr:hypothetical protein [Armatimonadota bacterium]
MARSADAQDNSSSAVGLPLTISLDGEWDFVYKPELSMSGSAPQLPVEQDYAYRVKMTVPGYWDDNHEKIKAALPMWTAARLYFPNFRKGWSRDTTACPNLLGVGFYKKMIDIPADWKSRSVTLYVGGARRYAWVLLNGELVGNMACYFLPYEFSLDKWIKPGHVNELIIVVSNLRLETSGYDADTAYAYGLAAGPYRPVSLKISGTARIADCYIRPLEDNKKLSWSVEIDGDIVQNVSLAWRIKSLDGRVTLGKGISAVEDKTTVWTTDTFGMKPWSDNYPNLYNVEVTLKDGGQTLDSISQRFGMRTVKAANRKLYLNGRPVMLRGTCECAYYPETTNPPMDVESYRFMIRRLKETGFNYLKLHTHVPSEEYMRAADELGVMLQVELPSGLSRKDQDTKEKWTTDGKAAWRLVDSGGKVYAKGVLPAGEYGTLYKMQEYYMGRITLVGAVEFTVPELTRPANGGSVVLLGTEPFPTLRTYFSTTTTGRAEGNVATVIVDHPVMRGFPHDGWCDWQFYSMLEGGSAVVFNDVDIPFEPVVEVVSSFKYIRKQSSLFELAVGKGKLIVCTMKLDLSDPASAYLLDRVLSYAESEEFKPSQRASARELLRLLGADLGEISIHETDYADDPQRR